MDDERLDLSAIDPYNNRQAWDRLAGSIAAQAWSVRRRRLTIGFQLLAWAHPVLAVAAMLALFSWAGALAASGQDTTKTVLPEDPVLALVKWAERDELPSTARVFYVMGQDDAD
jgi:hypothetical protein